MMLNVCGPFDHSSDHSDNKSKVWLSFFKELVVSGLNETCKKRGFNHIGDSLWRGVVWRPQSTISSINWQQVCINCMYQIGRLLAGEQQLGPQSIMPTCFPDLLWQDAGLEVVGSVLADAEPNDCGNENARRQILSR
jgi:hypothetical protein